MKRLLFVLFALLLACTPCHAEDESISTMLGMWSAGSAAPSWSCDCSGAVSFCWSMENTTLTSGSPAGCTDGADTSATGSSTVALDSDGTPVPQAGSNTLSIPTSNDYYEFDVTAEDAIATEAGRVDFWVYTPTGGTLSYFTVAHIDASNYIAVGVQTGGAPVFRYYSAGGNGAVTCAQSTVADAWNHIVASWSVAGEGGLTLRIGVNQTDTDPSFTTDTDTIGDMGDTGLTLRLGDGLNAGAGGGYHYDNLRVYKTW